MCSKKWSSDSIVCIRKLFNLNDLWVMGRIKGNFFFGIVMVIIHLTGSKYGLLCYWPNRTKMNTEIGVHVYDNIMSYLSKLCYRFAIVLISLIVWLKWKKRPNPQKKKRNTEIVVSVGVPQRSTLDTLRGGGAV